MQLLTPCTTHVGGRTILKGSPDLIHLDDVVYIPQHNDWGGLYESGGNLISQSGMFRGPERHLVLPAPSIESLPSRNHSLDGRFLYLGPIHPHFGHFLLSTLSRLWPLVDGGLDGRKILFDSAGGIETRFAKPYFAAIMAALSLTPDDFMFVAEPAWVSDVICPAPSFTELLECHQEFRSLTLRIANNLPRANRFTNNPRLYLSKSQLVAGVWRFENELELEEQLGRRGVTIVHPERLPFAEQVGLFCGENHIISTMGSAIHTLVFGRTPGSMTILCRENQILSNFSMIDDLVGACPAYFFPPKVTPVAAESFGLSLSIENPARLADELFAESASANTL